jgi:mannan endo-1,4-beta-mannosidase
VQGVDSADVINMPQVNFGTFQLFPDQNNYGSDPSLSPLNSTVEAGISWIEMQAQLSAT